MFVEQIKRRYRRYLAELNELRTFGNQFAAKHVSVSRQDVVSYHAHQKSQEADIFARLLHDVRSSAELLVELAEPEIFSIIAEFATDSEEWQEKLYAIPGIQDEVETHLCIRALCAQA